MRGEIVSGAKNKCYNSAGYANIRTCIRNSQGSQGDIFQKYIKLFHNIFLYFSILLINYHEPKLYPNPDQFIPDRFSPEEIQKRPSCSFLPFGDGNYFSKFSFLVHNLMDHFVFTFVGPRNW